MEPINWSLMGLAVGVFLGLIAWKPKRPALVVFRVSFLVFQSLLIISAVCWGVMEHLRSQAEWMAIGVLPPVLIWSFLLLLIERENRPLPLPTERIILGVNLATLLFFTFKWVFVHVLTSVFLWFFPLGWMVLLFFTAFIWAGSYCFRRSGKEGFSSWKPILFSVLTALAVILAPLDDIGTWTDCWFLLMPREAVVHRIESGSSKVEGRTLELSGWERCLSFEGKVEVQGSGNDMKVMFIDAEGFLSDFSGFIYCRDGSAPREGDFTIVDPVIKKLKDHWYYAISRN